MNSRQFYTLFTPFKVRVDTSNYIIQAQAGMHTTRVFVLATNWSSLQDTAGSTTLSMRNEIQETGLEGGGRASWESVVEGDPRLA
jgi:hypothetical protein